MIGLLPGGSSRLRHFAPMYMWSSISVRELYSKLSLDTGTRTVLFAFLGPRGELQLECSAVARVAYFFSSRGCPPRGVGPWESVMSSSYAGKLDVMRVGVEGLIKTLTRSVLSRGHLIAGVCVRKVTFRRGVIELLLERSGRLSKLRCGRVINTLPAPLWDTLTGHEGARAWLTNDKWFATTRRGVHPSWYLEARAAGYEYLYSIDPNVPFDRVKVQDPVVYEFNSAPSAAWLVAMGARVALHSLKVQVIGPGRAEGGVSPEHIIDSDLVLHLGRMAQWDHSIRLHTVVECLMKMGECK